MAFIDPTKRVAVSWQDYDGPDRARLTVAWLDEDNREMAYDLRGLHAYWIAQVFKNRDAVIDRERTRAEHAEEDARRLRALLARARALVAKATDGGMTDYSEAPNEPVCGYCGYEVETCQRKGWDDDGQPFTEDNPCPGIEARAFLVETEPR